LLKPSGIPVKYISLTALEFYIACKKHDYHSAGLPAGIGF
jgi:hypothetical protein